MSRHHERFAKGRNNGELQGRARGRVLPRDGQKLGEFKSRRSCTYSLSIASLDSRFSAIAFARSNGIAGRDHHLSEDELTGRGLRRFWTVIR